MPIDFRQKNTARLPQRWLRMTCVGMLCILSVASQLCAQSQIAGEGDWDLTIACWNLAKLTSGNLQNRDKKTIGERIAQWDIVVLQELYDSNALAAIGRLPQLRSFDCTTISNAVNAECYGICYKKNIGITIQKYGTNFDALNAKALNGRTMKGYEIWCWPPYVVNFIKRTLSAPFGFDLITIHTKTEYEKTGVKPTTIDLPQGVPPVLPKNIGNGNENRTSKCRVYDELTSLETKIEDWNRQDQDPTLVIGDLNADGANYPRMFFYKNFKDTQVWTWYPGGFKDSGGRPSGNPQEDQRWQYTKVKNRKVALDRAILDSKIQNRFWEFGVDTAASIKYPQVSDHYPIWVRIGNRDPNSKKRSISAKVGIPAAAAASNQLPNPKQSASGRSAKRAKTGNVSVTSDNNPPVTNARLFIIQHDPLEHFKRNSLYELKDVRPQGSTLIPATESGSFTLTDVWANPSEGAYNLVYDDPSNTFVGVNNTEYVYDKNTDDFTNYDNQIDLLVVEPSQLHSDVVTLDDRGKQRELFNAGGANHIYVLVSGLLPAARQNPFVDIYVVSMDLLQNHYSFTTWEAARKASPAIQLDKVIAVPVNLIQGRIPYELLKDEDIKNTLQISDEGLVFANIWPTPSNLIMSYVEPEPNDFKTFTEYYGKRFAIVVDVNRNGIFDTGDKVDTHEIGPLADYFENNELLNEHCPVDAVKAYQEFLNERVLPESRELSVNGVYDDATKNASDEFLCQPYLTKSRFNLLSQYMQTTFVLLPSEEYLENKKLPNGVYRYEQVIIKNLETDPASGPPCIVVSESCLFDKFNLKIGFAEKS